MHDLTEDEREIFYEMGLMPDWYTPRKGEHDMSEATKEQREAWRLSALRYTKKLEIRIAELVSAGQAMADDYAVIDSEGDFRHDPQLLAEWDAARMAS